MYTHELANPVIVDLRVCNGQPFCKHIHVPLIQNSKNTVYLRNERISLRPSLRPDSALRPCYYTRARRMLARVIAFNTRQFPSALPVQHTHSARAEISRKLHTFFLFSWSRKIKNMGGGGGGGGRGNCKPY